MKLRHTTEEDLYVRWIPIDGLTVRTAIRRGTNEGVPLLLLNGIGGSIEMLLPFVDALPETTVIMIDVPGAGKSPAPSFPWRLRNYATACRKVLDQLDQPIVNIMGISWGGALAQQFAKQFPERCSKLILAATSPGQFMVPGRPRVLMHLINPRRYYDKAYMKKIAGTIYGGKFRTNALAAGRFADLTNPPSKRGYYYQMLAIVGWSSLPWLRRIRQPTMIMHGTDDPLIPFVNARLMASLIPNANLQEFDCGHLFILTRTKRTASIVTEFALG